MHSSWVISAVLASLASVVHSQVTVVNGAFECLGASANLNFCGGANIIIRCTGTVGQPGNCDDNLSGEPPVGVSYAPCYESSPTAGDAACSKDGIVYPDNGVSFPIPSSAEATGDGSSPSDGGSGVTISLTTTITATTIVDGETITVIASIFSSGSTEPVTTVVQSTAAGSTATGGTAAGSTATASFTSASTAVSSSLPTPTPFQGGAKSSSVTGTLWLVVLCGLAFGFELA